MNTKQKGILLSSLVAAFAVSSGVSMVQAQNQPNEAAQPAPSQVTAAAGVIAPQAAAVQTPPYATGDSAAYTNAPATAMQVAPAPAQAPPAADMTATAVPQVATASANKSTGPYVKVYEFGARWCPSCRQLKPVVHDTMEKYKGFGDFTYVDTDRNPDLVRQLNILQIPQVIIVDRRGRMLNRLTGYEQGLQLDAILNNYKQQIQAKRTQ